MVIYAFDQVNEATKKKTEDLRRRLVILIMVMRAVDEQDLIEQFISLCLDKGNLIAKNNSIEEIIMMGAVFGKNTAFFYNMLVENKHVYFPKIASEITEFYLLNEKYYNSLIVKRKGDMSIGKHLNKFCFTRFLDLLPQKYTILEKIFDYMCNMAYLYGATKKHGESITKTALFANRINKLSIKDQRMLFQDIIHNI